ncbi:MAG: hypothetical protein WCS80_04820 [Bacilli bacterium]
MNNINDIRRIKFWKRSSSSVEQTEEVEITIDADSQAIITVRVDGKEKRRPLKAEEREKLLSALFDEYQIDKTEKDYRAYKYEDSLSDYTLKFFLVIDFKDKTYLAIKGIRPFEQPHYQDLTNLMTAFIN